MNTRKKGYQMVNETINFMKKVWWRGKVEHIGMSGQLEGKKGDLYLYGRENYNRGFFRGEGKKGRQVNITKLIKWLEKDASHFLVLEPHGTKQKYIFLPMEIWGEMVGEW